MKDLSDDKKKELQAFLNRFPAENVRKQYADNAKQLRWMASKAAASKNGIYCGANEAHYLSKADEFEHKAKTFGL